MTLNLLESLEPFCVIFTVFKNHCNPDFVIIIACTIVFLTIAELIYLYFAKQYFLKFNRYKGSPDDKFYIYDKRDNSKPYDVEKALLCLKICQQSYLDYPQVKNLNEILKHFPSNIDDLKDYDINLISYIKDFIDNYHLEYLHSKTFNNGFFAFAFKNKKTDEIIIAFRGSNDTSDWLFNNYTIMTHTIPDQTFAAIDFYRECRLKFNQAGKHSMIITGHSLGGGLAQLVGSFEPDTAVYTFNAVGVYHLLDEPDFYQYIGLVNPESHVFKKYMEVVNKKYDDADIIKDLSSLLSSRESKLCTDNIYNLVCSSDIVGNVSEHIGETDFSPACEKSGVLEALTINYLRLLSGVRLSVLSFLRRNFLYPLIIDFLEGNSCLLRKKLADKQNFYSFFFNNNPDSKIKDFLGKFSYILFTFKYPFFIILFSLFSAGIAAVLFIGLSSFFPEINLKLITLKSFTEFICSYLAAFAFLSFVFILALLFLFKFVLKKSIISHNLDLLEKHLLDKDISSELFQGKIRHNLFLYPQKKQILSGVSKLLCINTVKITGFLIKIPVVLAFIFTAMLVSFFSTKLAMQEGNVYLSLLIFPIIFSFLTFMSLNIFSTIFKSLSGKK